MTEKTGNINWIIRASVFFIWTLLIYFSLTWPFSPGPDRGFTLADKIAHFILFGVFAGLLFNIWRSQEPRSKIFRAIVVFFITLAWAAFLEYKQQFILGRYPSWLDFFSGWAGAATFLIICWRKKN